MTGRRTIAQSDECVRQTGWIYRRNWEISEWRMVVNGGDKRSCDVASSSLTLPCDTSFTKRSFHAARSPIEDRKIVG